METRATSSAAPAIATTAATATDPDSRRSPSTMAHISVWCIVINDKNDLIVEPFLVDMGHHDEIIRFKMAMKEGPYKDSLADVNIANMEVWKCNSLILRGASPNEIAELVKNLAFPRDGWQLGGWARVTELQLQEYEPLVVRAVEKAKRPREGDYLQGARLSKLARLEPSKVNDASIYEKLQESQRERILDDCPNPDADIPPLPLLYFGFGDFHDAVENPSDDLLETGLMNEVDQLVNAMCNLGYENRKPLDAQGHLQQIFSVDAPREFSYVVDNGSQATTDGYLVACHGGPLLIIEYKRQIAMAEPQLSSYFLQLALKSVDDIFRQWRQPALGLLIRGTYISFHGLVMIDEQVRVLPLTPAFPCNDSELHNRIPLYAAFGAACRLLNRIDQDATDLVNNPLPAIPGPHRRHPNVHSLLRVSSNDSQAQGRINFEITERFMTGLEGNHLLYLASTTGPDRQILLKFSRKYSPELHQFCTVIGYAPELLAFERLPGGWFGIAMQYFPSAVRILESSNIVNYGEKWLKDIDSVVAQFHAQGFVHGDLRPPNFIVDEQRLLLTDFDWGGKEMEATFPQRQLHPILRDNRQETRITKARDMTVMEYTKKEIRNKIEGRSSGGTRS